MNTVGCLVARLVSLLLFSNDSADAKYHCCLGSVVVVFESKRRIVQYCVVLCCVVFTIGFNWALLLRVYSIK